jgi:hypothetical protein
MNRLWLRLAILAVGAGLVGLVSTTHALEQTTMCDTAKSPWCVSPKLNASIDLIAGATVPKLATPSWMTPPVAAGPKVVKYSVSTRGTITANLDEFKSIANATLNDSRGWTRLGVSFSQVESGGDFTLFLSEAAQMTSFSATGCDVTYSCNVGSAVIINQDRWLGSSPSWTSVGGDLASYRQMVINHETGHWLGHGHRTCGGAGQPAPVMQQQSMDMQGCAANPWPLSIELYSPKLGIRS